MNAASTVFTKASPAGGIIGSNGVQLHCFPTAPTGSSGQPISPSLSSGQQHQYKAYAYYSSLPATSKFSGFSPSLQQIRSHFFSAPPTVVTPPNNSALEKTSPSLCHDSNSYITNKVAATLLQLQDPVLRPVTAAAPSSNLKLVSPAAAGSPQLGSVGDDGSPTSLDQQPNSSASPSCHPPTTPYPPAQFLFQNPFAPPHFPTAGPSPQPWHQHHSAWPYLPLQHDYKANSCHICGKTYARLSTLRSHLKSHSGEKPYQCSICQKSFTQAANLTAHLRTHSGEKPFKCPVCHRGFSQSSSVTTHMRTHSGDRPYKCNVCNKGFADSSTLTKHYRTHTGEKPYQCKICEARFSQSGNLNRHMRTHRHHYVSPAGVDGSMAAALSVRHM